MDRSRKKPSKVNFDSSKNLVGEQPGMTVLLTGLIIAFVLGYLVKSLLSPARVTARIEKAASHIDKNLKVQFGSARLSLSEGILPQFSVVITDITMESSLECWMAPFIEINELRLPLSIWGVITGHSPVENIEADAVDLALRSDFKKCETNGSSSPGGGGVVSSEPARPLVKLATDQDGDRYKNAVTALFVTKFNIHHVNYPQYTTQLLNFSTQVKSFEPKVIIVKAKTHLLRDEQVGDYLSHANLYLEYKESPEATLQAHFFGNWREGHYSIISNYTLSDRMLSIETDLKHIPFSQILGVMKKYNLVSNALNSRQAWVSAKSRYMGPADKINQSPFEVNDIKIEGDVGELRVERINFYSLNPIKYQPIQMDIKKLHIERLLEFLNQKQRPKILGHLGEFSGTAEIVSDKNMHLRGEHSGLEFIFANKGQREVQVIDTMRGQVDLVGDYWNFRLNEVQPHGGSLLGDLQVRANRSFEEVEVKANVDQLTLADSVQKLMTDGGSIGAVSMDADVKIKDSVVESLKGQAHLKQMAIEGIEFGDTKAQFDWAKQEIIMNLQIAGLTMTSEATARDVLEPVFVNHVKDEDPVVFDKVTGQLRFNQLKAMSWKGMQGSLGKNTKLATDGSWDENGILKGSVNWRDGKAVQAWSIGGNRNAPAFFEDHPAERKLHK